MPVIPTVKTYGRSKNVNSNCLSKHTVFPSSKASTVFDALFAKNIEKRNTSSDKTKKIITRARRKQIIIEELPLPGPSQLSTDDSVHFIANTTFDNLLKGPQYNNVKFGNTSAIQIDSSIENSKYSDDHSSGYNTRKKARKDYAKLHSNNEHIKSKVNSKGKANKHKISEKKKISKSIKVVLKQIADESTTDTVTKNNISNSFDKSISHSLIIEKETKKRNQNSMEISRVIAESNRKYREKYFNASVVCARKFTPIISTSSRILPKKSLTSESNCSQIFQHGFRHCMRAESTPKYMLSSTPIPSNKQHQISENPDVSPITARSRSQLSCKSRLTSLMDLDCEIVPSFILPSKKSLINASSIKDTVNIISPSVSVKPEEASVKSPYNLRTNDDSRINYSSLLKYRPRVSYTKRRVKSASAIEGNSVTKSQRYSLVNDIKLSVHPVVVIERNLDLLGITGKVRLLCSFNSHNDIDVSDYKKTDKHAVQNNEHCIASELHPVVLLENLSHSSTKQRVRTVTTRSHSLKHSRHSDNVNGNDVSKSMFNSTELKRSNSESNIHCDDQISTLEISGEKDVRITNDSVINLVSDTSENVIENSQRESVKKPLYHITTRRKKVVSINPVNEVINARETTQNRFGISLQEWERFSQSNICIVKIDHVANENSFKTSLALPTTTPDDNDVITKEKSEINSTCTNKHISPIQNHIILTRSRKSSKTHTDVTRKSNNTIIGKQSIFLKPGKKWFRSLSILRRTNIHNVNLSESCNKGRKWRDSVYEILENQEGNESKCYSF